MNNNRSITNNVLWKFAERFFAQIVSFAVSLVLARILLPKDYGVVAIILVFIELANAFVTYGLGNSLIQKKDSDDVDFSSVLYFNLGLSLVLYLILFFFSPLIANFYNQQLLVPITRVFGIRLFFAAINSVQQAYVAKQMIFKRFFWATFIGTIVSGAVGILMALRGFGAWALVAQYITNTTIDTIVLSFFIKWRPKAVFSWKRIGKLFKFGWKILYEGVFSTLSSQIRSLIIGKVYTESDLGHYSKANQFPDLIMNNINLSISAVLFPAMSNIQDQEEKMIFLMRKSVKITSYILFPMLFGMAAVASNMVTVLLTDKWSGCIPFVYIACFCHLMTIGMYPRHQALKAKGKSGVFMIEHAVSRVINFLILLAVFRISVLSIAISSAIGSVILMIIIMYTSKRFTGYKYKDQVKDVGEIYLMSILMFVLTFKLGIIMDFNPIVELIIQVVVGATIYLLLSVFLKPEGFAFCISFVKKIFKKEGANG